MPEKFYPIDYSERNQCQVRLAAPYPFTYRFRVKTGEADARLVDFLHNRFPFRDKIAWTSRIESGNIVLNGRPVAPGVSVLEGDLVEHHNPRVVEPSVPDNVRILEETDAYLTVFKPAPMPVHPGGRYYRNSLLHILHDMGYEKLFIIHRLDAVTSGLILFGKNARAAREAQFAFTSGSVEKIYHAVVSGTPETDVFSCDEPVIREKGFVFRSGDYAGAKPARTDFVVEKRIDGYSLIRCMPVTGRTHQIRLHLKASGFPVLNDPVYGVTATEGSIQNRAIFLMQSGLRLPDTGIDARIPVPDSWARPGLTE